MGLTALAPKSFLCYYSLRTGALCISIGMCIIFAGCTIATTIQALSLKRCEDGVHRTYMISRTYSVTAVVFSIAMLIVNLWFIWGILKSRATVALAWAVITSMWLAQTFCLLIVSICFFAEETTAVAWIISFCFGIVAVGIMVYAILVGLGYWLELKHLTVPAS